jgi:hypothetical protein
MTLALLRGTSDADVTLYVHSARVSHFAAAALFAAVRRGHALDSVEGRDGELAELH